MPQDAFTLKIQRELSHPKCAQKVSGLSRNGLLDPSLNGSEVTTEGPWSKNIGDVNLLLLVTFAIDITCSKRENYLGFFVAGSLMTTTSVTSPNLTK